jgi:hypothetical protein
MEIRLAVSSEEVRVVEMINELIVELGGSVLPVIEAA